MKYAELKKRISELERELQLARLIIQHTHEELDKLGAPSSDSKPHPGHRITWYMQAKEKEKQSDSQVEQLISRKVVLPILP